MASEVDRVTKRLKEISFPFNRVKIVPGFIEETIKFHNLPTKICFTYSAPTLPVNGFIHNV